MYHALNILLKLIAFAALHRDVTWPIRIREVVHKDVVIWNKVAILFCQFL